MATEYGVADSRHLDNTGTGASAASTLVDLASSHSRMTKNQMVVARRRAGFGEPFSRFPSDGPAPVSTHPLECTSRLVLPLSRGALGPGRWLKALQMPRLHVLGGRH